MWSRCFDGVNDGADDLVREKVLSSDLDDAGRRAGARGEDCREVEVVRDDDEAVLARPCQDISVRRGRRTERGPVDRLESVSREPVDPSLATGSCPQEASRLAEWNFDFLSPPGGVGQGLGDVLGFQVRIRAENLIARPSCSDEADDRADRDAHAANTRLSTHYRGVTSDAR